MSQSKDDNNGKPPPPPPPAPPPPAPHNPHGAQRPSQSSNSTQSQLQQRDADFIEEAKKKAVADYQPERSTNELTSAFLAEVREEAKKTQKPTGEDLSFEEKQKILAILHSQQTQAGSNVIKTTSKAAIEINQSKKRYTDQIETLKGEIEKITNGDISSISDLTHDFKSNYNIMSRLKAIQNALIAELNQPINPQQIFDALLDRIPDLQKKTILIAIKDISDLNQKYSKAIERLEELTKPLLTMRESIANLHTKKIAELKKAIKGYSFEARFLVLINEAGMDEARIDQIAVERKKIINEPSFLEAINEDGIYAGQINQMAGKSGKTINLEANPTGQTTQSGNRPALQAGISVAPKDNHGNDALKRQIEQRPTLRHVKDSEKIYKDSAVLSTKIDTVTQSARNGSPADVQGALRTTTTDHLIEDGVPKEDAKKVTETTSFQDESKKGALKIIRTPVSRRDQVIYVVLTALITMCLTLLATGMNQRKLGGDHDFGTM